MNDSPNNIDPTRGLGYVMPLLARWHQLAELADLRDSLESQWQAAIVRSDELLKRKARITAETAELAKDEAELSEECARIARPLAGARWAHDELHRLVRRYQNTFTTLDINPNPKGSNP